jgi:hypothetical protein
MQYIYIYIIDSPETLCCRGFFENEAPDAPLPKNAPTPLRALATLLLVICMKGEGGQQYKVDLVHYKKIGPHVERSNSR